MQYKYDAEECDHANVGTKKVFNSTVGVKETKHCKDCGTVFFDGQAPSDSDSEEWPIAIIVAKNGTALLMPQWK